MEKEENRLDKEIFFLIAKFLHNSYPEVAQVFIKECEKHQLFPSSVFLDFPSFEQLNNSIYPTVPSSQLMDLLMRASKRFTNPSFLRPLVLQKIPVKQVLKRFLPAKRILGHTFIIYCLAIEKTSQILITGSDDSLIKVWKLPELSLINTYLEHDDVITNIEIHPSNQYFASSSGDGIICVFSLLTGILKVKKKLPSGINDIHFSECGNFFSVSTKENGFFLWNFDDFLHNRPEYRKWSDSNHSKNMWWARFTPSSALVIFVTSKNDIYAYHITQKRTKLIYHSSIEINSISLNHKIPYKILCILHHCSYFLVFTRSQSHNSIFSKRVKLDVDVGQCIVDAQFNCDETLIVALTKNSGIYAWNSQSFTLIYHFDNVNYLRRCHLFLLSPIDPYFVFVANKDHCCSFWDLSKSPVQNMHASSSSDQVQLDEEVEEGISDGVFHNEEEVVVVEEETNENATIAQSNPIQDKNDSFDSKPLYTYVVYFRLSSLSWSPNGEYILASDDLQGFTLFLQSTGDINIKTEHQFLLKERSKCEVAMSTFDRLANEETGEQDDFESHEHEEIATNVQLQSFDDSQNILVDSEWNPIFPQPKRWKFHQINLRIKRKSIPADIIAYESTFGRIFKK